MFGDREFARRLVLFQTRTKIDGHLHMVEVSHAGCKCFVTAIRNDKERSESVLRLYDKQLIKIVNQSRGLLQ